MPDPASDLASCVAASAGLPASERAAWHRRAADELAQAAVERAEWGPGWIVWLPPEHHAHRVCEAMFAACEGTRGGPADA